MSGKVGTDEQFRLTGAILRKVAGIMIPFYRKIACNYTFALRWSRAVRRTDLDTLDKMFKSVAPSVKLSSLASNGIGYFFDFEYPEPIIQYSCGLTIPPGTTQFTFSTPVHRMIARAILPFYRALRSSSVYAAAIARAVNARNIKRLRRLVRLKVKTAALKRILIAFSGVALNFKYKRSKYMYQSLLFREIVG
ncbi:hypothetical protein A8990_1577 [Paenibacillus taihuensis]|uniref:Uncharacterized protein n=1 Tax=Paenibacillus taihuensis TaxID=1156355 RepID=A0A3D9Q3P6_9BACL|nr:hypothetical protein [Paenibacillus taihuensis]REE57361.1 hypothetical protein A8990_1577 [Paenibacillus taihuensis]